jgi:hypothetical protein
MATTYTYYKLVGLDPKRKMPGGLIREAKDNKDGLWFEHITLEGDWLEDSNLIRYFAGCTDEAEKISNKEANTIIEYFKS